MRETRYSQKLCQSIRKLNIGKEEKTQLLLCLYLNGCPLEDCAKLFNVTEEKIVKFLEFEELYKHQACNKCGKLKNRISQFRQCEGRSFTICKECNNDYGKKYGKKYYKDNKEHIKEYMKEYYKDNKERKKEYVKAYQEKNQEKIKEYQENNKEKRRKQKKEYNEKNKQKNKEYYKKYNKFNKEKRRDQNKKYKNSQASVEHVQKLVKFEEVLDNRIRCKYCGRWMTPTVGQVTNRLQGTEANDNNYIYCSEECKQECPTYNQKKYPKGFKPASSREVDPTLRQLVLERDNYTCQKCGKYENVKLHCHHIIPVINSPMEANDSDNCITLCKECHMKVHKTPDCQYSQLRCNSKD